MNEKLKKIHEYLLSKGVEEKTILNADTSSVYLAMEIMEYAHREQKRENGEDYANHPARCLTTYRELIGIGPNGDRVMDKDLLYRNNVPFDGVQEVCLLHDVIEDTEFTIDDIKEIYSDCGFDKYFDLYIEQPLMYITHNKEVDYGDYIKVCLKHPTSALVKMIDMQDNLRILDLTKYDEERYHRAQGYLFYSFIINEGYHFIENVQKYKAQLKEEQ